MVVGSVASVTALVGLFATNTVDEALRALGARPKPLPRAEDTSLLHAVILDQQQVHATAVSAGATEVAELLGEQLSQLGAKPAKASAEPQANLKQALRAAARNRAVDASAAISPQFAQVLASMSAGLTQAVELA